MEYIVSEIKIKKESYQSLCVAVKKDGMDEGLDTLEWIQNNLSSSKIYFTFQLSQIKKETF